MLDNPGGTLTAVRWGDSTNSYSGGVKGGVLFYDWDQISESRMIDHTAIQVGRGYDTTDGSIYGDYVDQQNADRYHVIWHRRPQNEDWRTTKIFVVTVDVDN